MNKTVSARDPIMTAYDDWVKDKDPVATQKLLTTLEPQIGTALHAFAPGMETHMRLKAKTMAYGAIQSYNPDKGMHLKSYVYQQLQPIQREFGKRSNPVSLPERHILEKNQLAQAEAEFESENSRAPSLEELADYTSTPIKRIEAVRAHKGQVSESRTINPETGDSRTTLEDDPQEAWAQQVYGSLGSVDQRIYEMTTGFGGSKVYPKGEIARKLKISAPAVSQRINKIASLLEEGLNLG